MIPTLAESSFTTIDSLDVSTLALFLTDQRPLRGAAGIVDWRLCGELSNALQSGSLTGALGERLLMPTHGRIGPKRLLIFGVGPQSRPLGADELTRMLEAAHTAGATELAIELPGNVTTEVAFDAVWAFLGNKLVLLGASDALRDRLSKAKPNERRPKRA